METTRQQVDEVTGIMKGNMEKIMERDGKLSELEMKADALQVEAQQFQVTRCTTQSHFLYEPSILEATKVEIVKPSKKNHRSCIPPHLFCCSSCRVAPTVCVKENRPSELLASYCCLYSFHLFSD